MDEDLIRAINQIQDVFNTLNVPNSIQLPEIVMLGSQSAGKSSVLESIVHRSFLPRGTGIVTRCPLVLQLIECKMNDKKYRKDANGTTKVEEWGEFLHDKDKIFTDFDKIREEIERRTDEIAGANKGICETPINLRIYSPNVVDLTLVDLPGITKVPIGDQPEDIEEQIKKLVMKYIENPNSLILSVSTANTDIATSESLKYAMEVDPEGLRTLAVLTKIDLMDRGTNAWDLLNGEIISVKLGIIGIINRSQEDIDENKTIDEQLEFEKEFFDKNYKKIAHKNGIPYLSKRLSNLLMDHISKCLPNLKDKINNKMKKYEEIYKSCEEIKDHAGIIHRLITELTKNFSRLVDGALMNKQIEDEIIGGPMFRRIFDYVFSNQLLNIQPEVDKENLVVDILNSGGPRPSVFASQEIFETHVKNQIERLRKPSIECVENIYEEMKKVLKKIIKDQHQLERFPNLKVRFHEILNGMLESRLDPVKDFINKIIDIEAIINTNHPDFCIIEILNAFKLENDMDSSEEQISKYDKTKNDAAIIEELILNYFPIVKKSVEDYVTKCIMYELINYMKDNIQVQLPTNLKESEYEMLLEESEENMIRRENAKAMIEALRAAKNTIDQIVNIN